MRATKTVYAVNAGSYSGYHIAALFSSKQLAIEYMVAVGGVYNEVEEFELDPQTANLIKRGYSVWTTHMLRDGTLEHAQSRDADSYSVRDIGFRIWRRSKAPAYIGKGIEDCLVSLTFAKSKEQAVKIANEQRIQTLANNQW